jgi:hypothetical protein
LPEPLSNGLRFEAQRQGLQAEGFGSPMDLIRGANGGWLLGLVWNEEIFGPVMAVMKFRTMEEVLAKANHTPYGLAAAVWTKDIGTAQHMQRCLKAGTVCLPPLPGSSKKKGDGKKGEKRTVGIPFVVAAFCYFFF